MVHLVQSVASTHQRLRRRTTSSPKNDLHPHHGYASTLTVRWVPPLIVGADSVGGIIIGGGVDDDRLLGGDIGGGDTGGGDIGGGDDASFSDPGTRSFDSCTHHANERAKIK